MRALQLQEWKSEPVLTEVPVPVPGPGEVLVQVGAAGACHSDLHLMHELEPGTLPWDPPFTLGHENAGWVHTLGEGVTGLEVGQAVAVVGAWGCGTCAHCLAGTETYCERPDLAPVPGGGGGLGMDGGMADYLLVPAARHLVPLPDGLEVVGGLGHLGVQVLKAITATRVIAVDGRESARAQASALGADLVLDPGPDTAERIREATGGRGADVVLDFVGSDETLATAAAAMRQLGDLTIVGIAGGTLPVSFFGLPYEASVQTTYWGNRSELVEVLDLAARGLLHAATTIYPLEDALAAYDDLAHGRVTGRAVIVPNDTFTR